MNKKKGKYIFFDIECSNGYNICSFGYCIISNEMKVLEKKDLIINPENKFILSPKGKRPKIELAYPEEFFYKQDNFKAYYERIKDLLCERGYILLGHSIQSDFYFLKYACERYNLPYLELSGFDTQKIFKEAFEIDHVESLEKILQHLEIENDKIIFHRSCDDALATFYVAREICNRLDISLEELLEKYSNCQVKNNNLNEVGTKNSRKTIKFTKKQLTKAKK